MKFEMKSLKQLTLTVLSLILLTFTTSCDNEDEQITSTPPENIIEASSQIVELMLQNAKDSSENKSCVTFKYPLLFSTYNTEFQIADTLTIENDQDLENLLLSLNDFSIVTNNFPLNFVQNGTEILANNNADVIETLVNAPLDCNTNTDCTVDSTRNQFWECQMTINSYNGDTATYENYKLEFGIDNDDILFYVNNALEHRGIYNIAQKANGNFTITINADVPEFDGTWDIDDCVFSSVVNLTKGTDNVSLMGCPIN